MDLSRRHFLRGALAVPAIVAASSLMPVRSIERLLAPTLWTDGVRCDADALEAAFRGDAYYDATLGRLVAASEDAFISGRSIRTDRIIMVDGVERTRTIILQNSEVVSSLSGFIHMAGSGGELCVIRNCRFTSV